jgi:hypothetical protein
MTPRLISLDDDQLRMVLAAAARIGHEHRSDFLQDIADQLMGVCVSTAPPRTTRSAWRWRKFGIT